MIVEAAGAAFPSYTFEVDSRAGLNLAIPLKGISLGFNFMQAERAVGSVTLSEAHTYGLDADYLLRRLLVWTSDPRVKATLGNMARTSQAGGNMSPIFLRVIGRVYLVGGVDVSLTNSRTTDANGKTSNMDAVDLTSIEPGKIRTTPKKPADGAGGETTSGGSGEGNTNTSTTNPATTQPAATDAANSTNASGEQEEDAALNAEKLNTRTTPNPLPGGAVAFQLATNRSVSMRESFPHPLVVGYIGFDVPILSTGEIGAPIATLYQLENITAKTQFNESLTLGDFTVTMNDLASQREALTAMARSDQPGERMKAIRIATKVANENDIAASVVSAKPGSELTAAEAESLIDDFFQKINLYTVTHGGESARSLIINAINSAMAEQK